MNRIFLLLVSAILVGCGQSEVPKTSLETSPKDGKLIFVKEDKAYFEQKDGTTLSVPLSELSELERQGALAMMKDKEEAPLEKQLQADEPDKVVENKSGSSPPEPVFVEVESSSHPGKSGPLKPSASKLPETKPESLPSENSTELVAAVQHLFQSKCHRCHGRDGTNEGGFNFVMNLGKLKDIHITPGDPANSYLFERMTDSDAESAMPPAGEMPVLEPHDIKLVRRWIEVGAPTPQTALRKFVRNEEVMQLVLDDLNALPKRNRRFYRYFLLTNLYNAGISEDELQTYRLALAKLINSLSWNPSLYKPNPINAERTILRIDLRKLNWTSEIWDEIADSNPYGITLRTTQAEKCYEYTQTEMPLARVDWFVYAASKPPLYHTILGIPETDDELEDLLRINADANIEQEKVVRAGFNRSGVSQNNRLIERHVTPYGGYWKSYDFAGNIGRQNLFEHPLGPVGADPFEHAGGEMIFTLPNGMQGYLLTDERGQRIDKGPTEIVSDPQRPDRAVLNGISCMSCHYAGMIAKSDEIRDVVLANRRAFDETERILAMYPGNDRLSKYYESDRDRFVEALQHLGIKRITKTSEPVSSMAIRFEGELDARSAASEFGLTQKELIKRIDETDTVTRSLTALKVPGGSVKRDSFVDIFQRAVEELEVLGRKKTARSVKSSSRSSGRRTRMATIRVADRGTVGEIRQFPKVLWGINALAFSPDGGWLAIGTLDQKVVVVDVDTKRELAVTDRLNLTGQVTCIAFSPDGRTLIAGGYSGAILSWDVSKRGAIKPKGMFPGHTKEVKCLSFSTDSRYVLSGGRDGILRYWELDSNKEISSVKGLSRGILACQISRNTREGIASDANMIIKVDLKSGEIDKTIPIDYKGISQTAAISPNGKYFVFADTYDLRVIDIEKGQELPRMIDREMHWSCTFSPNGNLLLSGGSGKVDIWDVEKHSRLWSYPTAGIGYCKAVSFSPDNLHVAGIGMSQRVISVFRLPPEKDR